MGFMCHNFAITDPCGAYFVIYTVFFFFFFFFFLFFLFFFVVVVLCCPRGFVLVRSLN